MKLRCKPIFLLVILVVRAYCHDDVIIASNNATEELDAFLAQERAWCPPSREIFPCTCDGPQRFLVFRCDRITELYSIAHAVRSASNFRSFGKFEMTNSRIPSIEFNILDPLRFEYIYLRKNIIRNIEKDFFESSRPSLKRIEVVHNDLEEFPFTDMSSFPKLEHIILKYNSLKTIPDEAFGNNLTNQIKQIDLSCNKISYIGSKAFMHLTKLEKVDLRYNKLTVINNMAFAAFRENTKFFLNLANNKIMYVSDGAFQNQVFKCLNLTDNSLTKLQESAFRDILIRMAERRTGAISVGGNRFRCTCDKVEWLVRLPPLYKLPLLDFECNDKGNKNVQDITPSEIGCSPN